MIVSQAVASRRSVRAFLPKPVPRELVQTILEQALRAPSGGNVQPWIVRVVAGETRDKVSRAVLEQAAQGGMDPAYEIYPQGLEAAHKQRQRQVAHEMYRLLGIERDDAAGRAAQLARNYEFFGAPVGLFFSLERYMGPPQWSDVGMLMQTLMLLAREHGLHSCPQEAWSVFHKTVAECLGMPDGEILFSGMALGYADEDAAVNQLRTERAPLDEVCTFHGF